MQQLYLSNSIKQTNLSAICFPFKNAFYSIAKLMWKIKFFKHLMTFEKLLNYLMQQKKNLSLYTLALFYEFTKYLYSIEIKTKTKLLKIATFNQKSLTSLLYFWHPWNIKYFSLDAHCSTHSLTLNRDTFDKRQTTAIIVQIWTKIFNKGSMSMDSSLEKCLQSFTVFFCKLLLLLFVAIIWCIHVIFPLYLNAIFLQLQSVCYINSCRNIFIFFLVVKSQDLLRNILI